MDEAKVSGLAAGEAYISGALTGIEDAPRMKLFYELLAEIAGAAKLRPYLPHRVTDPVATAHLDPRAVYEIDRAHVTAAAVVVAYAGLPSFGVGIEVELAREHGIPVIIVAESERAVSRLLLGNPAVVEVVRFADLDGLRRSLAAAFERVAASPRGVSPAAVADDVVVQRFITISSPESAPSSGPRRYRRGHVVHARKCKGCGGKLPRKDGKRSEEAKDKREAGLAQQEGQPWAEAWNGPGQAQLEEGHAGWRALIPPRERVSAAFLASRAALAGPLGGRAS